MYKETVKTTNKNISFYLENQFEQLFINDSKLELSSLDSLNLVGETVVASCLVVSISIGSYFKSALYHYLYDNFKLFGSKPINVLILIQAIIQHFTCLFMVINYTVGLYFNFTVSEHLGEAWCNLPWYVQAFGAGYRNFGSLGIAIIRLLLIKRNNWIKDKLDVMKSIVLAASLILSAMFAVGFGMGNGPASRKQVTWNFCTGKSENFREIEHNYSLLTGEAADESEFLSEMALIVSLISVGLELTCYIMFFRHLNDHDEGMLKKKILSTGEVKRRRRQNAITFLGQFYGFGVEMLVYSGLIYTMREKASINYRLGLVVGFWIEFGLLSGVEVMTSTNLKHYLPHNHIGH